MTNAKDDPFYNIESTIAQLRQNANTRQRYPQEIWDAIIQLAKTYSVREISLRLNISSSYLKQKIQNSHKSLSLDFREITSPVQACANMVYIELISDSGLKAKIQGHPSCLNFLNALFR